MFQSGVQRPDVQTRDSNSQVVSIYIIFEAMKPDESSEGDVHIVKKSKD